MNTTDQMTAVFHAPTAALTHSLPPTYGCTRALPPMDESPMRRAPSFRRLGRRARSGFRRWDVHHLPVHACRAAVDCLAMAGCVLFGVLATLLLGL